VFLKKLLAENIPLTEYALYCHNKGTLLPDTYMIDLDTIEENAQHILREANNHNVGLYYMLKQLGRVPTVGKMLSAMGYRGAVCVDFREALGLMINGVRLGHVGHLSQIPKSALEKILNAKPEILTVYSVEKAAQISEICSQNGLRQDIMLRIIGDTADLYPGQYGGFRDCELEDVAKKLELLPGINIAGVCSFPCILYDNQSGKFKPTPNLFTVIEGAKFLTERGFDIRQINLPSCTCTASIPLIASEGGNFGEPGHGLMGTTPYHAVSGNGPERPAVLYLSEISHNLDGKAYCYGGGWYRRSGNFDALVGSNLNEAIEVSVIRPSVENIDYYFELERSAPVGAPVIMSFRTQIFDTRSHVAAIRGLMSGRPEIEGIYSSLGDPIYGVNL
jgi:predicted amino acid racemase